MTDYTQWDAKRSDTNVTHLTTTVEGFSPEDRHSFLNYFVGSVAGDIDPDTWAAAVDRAVRLVDGDRERAAARAAERAS